MSNFFTYQETCMGTIFTFRIATPGDETNNRKFCRDAMEILHEADSQFSLYKDASETSRLNRGEISWSEASRVQVDVKTQCETWKRRTAGFFDAISPAGIYDPSGLVKTWAASNAAQFLEANGFQDFTLNAGGDVFMSELITNPVLKRVGISNLKPISSEHAGVNLVIDVSGSKLRGVATSGNIERGEHIWRKSQDQELPIQVTVAAKDLITADIWATAIYSGGTAALDLMEDVEGPESAAAICFMNSGRVVSSTGFAQLLGKV